jgi:hypothetical protein
MLSNYDIDDLIKKMSIPNFKGCFYKDTLKKIQPNSSYILNLNSEFDTEGKRNNGSHWTALVTDDMNKALYFDSYGQACPNEIRSLAKSSQYKLGHTTKNIQSLMSNLCGFFCLAFINFLTVSKFKTGRIMNDASVFLDLFEDLDLVDDVYKNEWILSLFFTQKDSKKLLFDNNNINMNKDNAISNKFNVQDKLFRS